MGDGWMMLEHAKGTGAETAFAEPRRYRARSAWKCGFQPAKVARRTGAREFLYWKGTAHYPYLGQYHPCPRPAPRIPVRTMRNEMVTV